MTAMRKKPGCRDQCPVIERGWFLGAATIWSLAMFAAGIRAKYTGL